jgi:hypothetical protein
MKVHIMASQFGGSITACQFNGVYTAYSCPNRAAGWVLRDISCIQATTLHIASCELVRYRWFLGYSIFFILKGIHCRPPRTFCSSTTDNDSTSTALEQPICDPALLVCSDAFFDNESRWFRKPWLAISRALTSPNSINSGR